MSLLWIEGFELYGDAGAIEPTPPEEGVWDQFTLSISSEADPGGFGAPARTGIYYAASTTLPGGMRRSLNGDKTTVGCGLGFWLGSLPDVATAASAIMQFRDVNNKCQIHLSVGTTGRLLVYRGGFDGRLTPSGSNTSGGADGLLGSSTLEIVPGTWNHIECKVVFATGTSGSVEVIVNGTQTFINLTGINTTSINADFTTCSQMAYGNFGPLAQIFDHPAWDDIYVYDQNTAGVHDFLGQYGVYALMPVSDDASHHDWLKTVGSTGWDLINEIPPDDDTNFIFSATVNDRSDFGVQALPSNITTVACVQPVGRLRKTDTGSADVEIGVNSAGTTSYSSDTPITTSWTWYDPLLLEQDPHTSSAWNPTAMPEVSVKRTV